MNKKQWQTLEKIFEKPGRSDILWSDIEKLFNTLGADLTEGKGSRIRVYLRGVKAVFHRPHPSPETNKLTVKNVRRFLMEAGVSEDGV